MNPETWDRLQELFAEIVELPPSEREARLAAADPDLAGRARALLDAHERARPLALESRLVDAPGGGFSPGLRLGPYELVAPIGRGGMGEVWRAERDEEGYRRPVAVKRIRHGLESEELLRRFRLERQALARLEHRSIARLLDAGVDAAGVPYLVLELVEGRPITAACDERRLGLDGRLALFEEVCRAVAYAHARLVVHRDLKPSNILLTANGEVRLLDFGVAKLLDPAAADEVAPTRTRGLLATPEYASPEQVAGDPVTTATDVHALGTLLYELLAGRRPFADHESTDLALARAIAEVEPPLPSAAAAAGAPEAAAERARARAASPRELARALRGDLDTIVVTALRKDPARRYASVERLAEDVARARAGRPILARPASAGYRLRRFIGRHRAAVALSAAAAALLAALVVQVFRQSAIARRERDAARAERDAGREVTEFLVALFEADPYAESDRPRDATPLGEFLAGSEREIREQLAGRPELRARLLTLLARLYANVGRLDAAVALAGEAVEERRRQPGPGPADLAESLNILGTALQENGDYDRAEGAFREALALREAALGELHADTAESVNNLAVLLAVRARPEDLEETERLERRGLDLHRRVLGADHLDTAQSLNNLAVFYYARRGPGDLETARTLLAEALEIRGRRLGADHPWVANTRSNLGNVLLQLGRPAEAEALFHEALRGWTASLGPEHARLASGWVGLSKALEARGDLPGALDAARRAAALDARHLPAGHPARARSATRLAELESRAGAAGGGAGR